MGLAFMCLTLVSGCGKNEKRICEAKGDAWYWDGSDNTCKEKSKEADPSAANTAEACKAKSGEYVWDAGHSQCKQIDYFMLIFPKDTDLHTVSVHLVKSGGGVEETELFMEKDQCVKVHESHVPQLRVKIKTSYFSLGYDEVCTGAAATGAGDKCLLGVYKIDSEGKLNKVTSDEERQGCTTLEPSANEQK